MTPKLKIGVQISGRGSNLGALAEACRAPEFPAEIVLVVSNNPEAGGLAIATAHNIPTLVIPHKQYKDRQAFEAALDDAHRAMEVQLICNAGFMRILSPWFVARWRGKMLNIHPSLLPAFPGLDTHRKVLDSGARLAGCTVHFLEEAVDAGAILVQAAVPVLAGDDEDALAKRVLRQEHLAYPLAVQLLAEGRLRYEEGRVVREEPGAHPEDNLLVW